MRELKWHVKKISLNGHVRNTWWYIYIMCCIKTCAWLSCQVVQENLGHKNKLITQYDDGRYSILQSVGIASVEEVINKWFSMAQTMAACRLADLWRNVYCHHSTNILFLRNRFPLFGDFWCLIHKMNHTFNISFFFYCTLKICIFKSFTFPLSANFVVKNQNVKFDRF